MQRSLTEYDAGVPSAHDPNRRFYPKYNGERWTCDCEHFRQYGTDCRHIKDKQLLNIYELIQRIFAEREEDRDIRDFECQDFDEIIQIYDIFMGDDVIKLSNIMLNIAIYRGEVSTDELHLATNEHYADNRIIGAVAGSLLKQGFLEVIGRKSTARKVAHGRGINIYTITEKGYEFIHQSRRPNDKEL